MKSKSQPPKVSWPNDWIRRLNFHGEKSWKLNTLGLPLGEAWKNLFGPAMAFESGTNYSLS